MGQLDGRVAVVTGAGRGIGAAVARVMASEGAKVVVNDLGGGVDGTGDDKLPAEEVAQQIRDAGGDAVANYDSVSNYAAAENIIKTALDTYGRLDVLVNVAGILRDRMVFNQTEQEWDAVLDVHLKGTFNTSKYASIYWRQKREGDYRLINFTSESGLYGAPGQPNYAAAKLGIVGFTYSCANALGRYGVTANCISPRAQTRMTDTVPTDRPGRRSSELSPEDLQRQPERVAPAVVYLASKQSGWLTGRVIGSWAFEISLFSNPTVIAEITKGEPWTLDELFTEMRRVFYPFCHPEPDAAQQQAIAAAQPKS